ncbi:peroxidase family protein [Prosthecomicrobium sp. N25]|uniref:peroxidase family protein n=1 Tax=Prosthecomicrobium sp. N25 TaxID=3129254 RepID=UPI003076B8C9
MSVHLGAVRSHGGGNRGLEFAASDSARDQVFSGRFIRMFDLRPARSVEPEVFKAIAEAMIKDDKGAPITEPEPVDENPTITAGYTYFGQFVDHDVTLDTTALNAKVKDEAAVTDFRSPALDLDCVYGRGPGDQPYLYEQRPAKAGHLRLGARPGAADAVVGNQSDVLRLAASTDGGPRDDFAILGDKRNDENKIVNQIHATIIQFHNRVYDQIATGPRGSDERFAETVDIVRWHYQYVVVHDYLKRILHPKVWTRYFEKGIAKTRYYEALGSRYSYMPLEFSVAAFRFGHSMVRPSYSLNSAIFEVGAGPRIPVFSGSEELFANLNGFPGTLLPDWGADWHFFLPGLTASPGTPADFVVPQPSYRIDALLVDPLAQLPEFKDQGIKANLAYRNLVRGQMNGLPSGERLARHVGLDPMNDETLWGIGSKVFDGTIEALPIEEKAKEELGTLKAARASLRERFILGHDESLRFNTPLWYYILREAEVFGIHGTTADGKPDPLLALGGHHLGPLGSLILAETFAGILRMDASSIAGRDFRPDPRIQDGMPKFDLAALFRFACG